MMLCEKNCAQSLTKVFVGDETRPGQAETWMAALSSSIEGLQKRMDEMNVPDVNLLAKL